MGSRVAGASPTQSPTLTITLTINKMVVENGTNELVTSQILSLEN